MSRIIKDKTLIRENLYTNKLPENVSEVISHIEEGLKEIYGDAIVKIIPLGSINGNWAVRKATGINQENNDIDWGIYVDVDQEFLENNNFNDIEEFLKKITDFVAYALSATGLESCDVFNAENCFLNKQDLVRLVAKSKNLVELYTSVPEDAFLEMQELAMIYQSNDPEIRAEYERLLSIQYPDTYTNIINVVLEYIREAETVKPHHFFRNRDELRSQNESTKEKFERLARRLQKLRESAGNQNTD